MTARGTTAQVADTATAAAVALRGARLSYGDRVLWDGLDLDEEQCDL